MNNVFRLMNINAGVGKLVTVLVTVFFMVHIVACLWYGIADLSNFEPDCWVVRKELQTSGVWESYVTSWYWSFQTLTTVGYGEIPAVTNAEKIVAIFWMVFGVGFYSFTIGNVQSIINEIDVREFKMRIKLDTLLDF